MATNKNPSPTKSFLRLIIFILALCILFFTYRKTPIKDKFIAILKPGVSTLQNSVKPISSDDVLNEINTYRTQNKMLALKVNPKLDKAALSRLAVIKSESDFSGSQTGVSLANAVKNNGYSYSTVADIYLPSVNSGSKLVDTWLGSEDSRKVITDKNLRDIGIATNQGPLSSQIYLILARLAAPAPVEKPGADGYSRVSWGGPELWQAVNKRRQELGVNPLSQKDELCTIASIRLNQLLTLGTLDGHVGFDSTLNRSDLVWIKDKYNLSEFLVVGYQTPADTVAAWEHTLGHRELLSGGQYVWGCVYSQDTFGVAITAY